LVTGNLIRVRSTHYTNSSGRVGKEQGGVALLPLMGVDVFFGKVFDFDYCFTHALFNRRRPTDQKADKDIYFHSADLAE